MPGNHFVEEQNLLVVVGRRAGFGIEVEVGVGRLVCREVGVVR